jgi:hypothetical protein
MVDGECSCAAWRRPDDQYLAAGQPDSQKVAGVRLMAYFFRTFGCSGDDEVAPHDFSIMVEKDEVPRFCPKCGAEFEGDPEIIPGGGHIGGSAIVRSVDGMYRHIEESSAERAALAGSPALKVTNMQDHLREGDVAVKMPNNTVTQYMEMAAGAGARYGYGGGAMTGVAFNTGPNPVPATGYTGPGHVALEGIQGPHGAAHLSLANEMTAAGQIKDSS